MSSYFILDVIRITFKIAINKNNVDFDELLSKSQICILKSTKMKFLSIDFYFNENINEKSQIIINCLYFELLSIDKFNSYYENDFVLMMNDHKFELES
jgi:hypothetical protein